MSLKTANDAYAFTAEPVLRTQLEVARENYLWATCTGEGEQTALTALLAAEDAQAAAEASMLSEAA